MGRNSGIELLDCASGLESGRKIKKIGNDETEEEENNEINKNWQSGERCLDKS